MDTLEGQAVQTRPLQRGGGIFFLSFFWKAAVCGVIFSAQLNVSQSYRSLKWPVCHFWTALLTGEWRHPNVDEWGIARFFSWQLRTAAAEMIQHASLCLTATFVPLQVTVGKVKTLKSKAKNRLKVMMRWNLTSLQGSVPYIIMSWTRGSPLRRTRSTGRSPAGPKSIVRRCGDQKNK